MEPILLMKGVFNLTTHGWNCKKTLFLVFPLLSHYDKFNDLEAQPRPMKFSSCRTYLVMIALGEGR